jgi:hypothetical protein
MAKHSQEVWENYTWDPKPAVRKGDQVWWFDEQTYDDGKRTSYSKKGF